MSGVEPLTYLEIHINLCKGGPGLSQGPADWVTYKFAIRERRAHPHREMPGMAFVRGRTSFEERFVKAAIPLSAPSLTAGSPFGCIASAEQALVVTAPETDCASVLSLAGGAAGAGPCPAPVGSAGGLQGVGVHSPSAFRAVRDCPDRLVAGAADDGRCPGEVAGRSAGQAAAGAAVQTRLRGARHSAPQSEQTSFTEAGKWPGRSGRETAHAGALA
jgi:hypothetical protein